MQHASLLIESQYLPPCSYFSLLRQYEVVYIEQHEHYKKGSYRNRCHIAGANGPLRLSVPLQKGKHQQTAVRDVRIDNKNNWQRQHWESIKSAYGNAPFFEFYADYFQPCYEQSFDFLFDWNQALQKHVLEILGLSTEIRYTEVYYPKDEVPNDWVDYREQITPKHTAGQTYSKAIYPQVFQDKHGFLPDMSIFDLLCCMGTESLNYL